MHFSIYVRLLDLLWEHLDDELSHEDYQAWHAGEVKGLPSLSEIV